MSCYVNTVKGPVSPRELGITLMHEHLAELNNSMKRCYADWFNADIFLEKIKPVFQKAKKYGLSTYVDQTAVNMGRDSLPKAGADSGPVPSSYVLAFWLCNKEEEMDSLKRLAASAVVPVVVLDDAKDAVATAKALLAGGVDVMEITFRTAAAADSIKAVAESCPDMLVGAGTVITLDQCRKAVECGAKFIVAPGFDEEVVRWCVENGVAVTPGCVTPTEIMAAMKLGLNVVKFFPAGVYGGLSAMKALSGPFGGIKFIPTGGVNTQNIGEFIAAPFIHAVGGSWVCPKADIAAGNFEKITELCKQARSAALGFEVAHIGVNCEDAAAASAVCEKLNEAFDLPVKDGNSSMFASSGIEVMKSMFKGKNGHIAIRTNSVELAAAELAKKGFAYDESSAKYKNGRMTVAYLKDEFGGFAVHLLQK